MMGIYFVRVINHIASPSEFSSLDEKGKSFTYTQTYGGVSGSHDLFYAYGTVKSQRLTENQRCKIFTCLERG